jgi:hypothetical protein
MHILAAKSMKLNILWKLLEAVLAESLEKTHNFFHRK